MNTRTTVQLVTYFLVIVIICLYNLSLSNNTFPTIMVLNIIYNYEFKYPHILNKILNNQINSTHTFIIFN